MSVTILDFIHVKIFLSVYMPLFAFEDCPDESWVLFKERCYSLNVSPHHAITWQEAEENCQTIAPGGHLVSISSSDEMIFLHYMLTTEWITNATESFIGNPSSFCLTFHSVIMWAQLEGHLITHFSTHNAESYKSLFDCDLCIVSGACTHWKWQILYLL